MTTPSRNLNSRKERQNSLSTNAENEQLRKEIDALHAAAEAREQQLLAATHAMDDILLEVESQRNTLKKKNKQLLELNAYIRSINDAMNSVLIVVSIDGQVTQANRVFTEALHWTEEELPQIHVDTLFPKEVLSTIKSAVSQHTGSLVVSHITQFSRLEIETELYKSNGTPTSTVYLVKGERFYSHQGKLQGILLTATDISELRERENALQQSQQTLESRNKELAETLDQLRTSQQQLVQAEKLASLGQLVAGVAHEINNPISFIIGNAHVLKRNAERLESYLEAVHANNEQDLSDLRESLRIDSVTKDLKPTVEDVLEAAGRVGGIVEALRDSSAEQAKKTSVDLKDIVALAVKWVSTNHDVRQTIQIHLTDSVMVWGHKGQLVQVVVNLLNNALHACRKADKPNVRIEIGQNNSQGWLCVSDNGTGLEESTISKIFDPFFTTKEVGEGSGLGLAISYRLITDHDGELNVINQTEGGAKFTVLLPLSTAQRSAQIENP
ncbi:PAS domain-containing sensor histidine kinase [Grimontia sp. AD028]|uniref:PAS domain-containing sensor histidine kinase n=1 Tax=Grimontia sp. AD028 TaxID=1581149 RepID=UPI0006969F77|nr:PAS domain-containing sensor histidine kinase [Grimontia sp. AD028]